MESFTPFTPTDASTSSSTTGTRTSRWRRVMSSSNPPPSPPATEWWRGESKPMTRVVTCQLHFTSRFQGSEEFFDGVIGACHADQLYRVEFDDGDVDDGVHVSNILPRKLAA